MIKIYTTKSCVYCHKAMDFMKENGIEFTELSLPEHLEEYEKDFPFGNSSVPTIVAGDKKIIGFDRARIMELATIGIGSIEATVINDDFQLGKSANDGEPEYCESCQ